MTTLLFASKVFPNNTLQQAPFGLAQSRQDRPFGRVGTSCISDQVIEVSGKAIHIKHVDGPVGMHLRNPSTGSGHCFSNTRIYSLEWEAKVFLKGLS